MYESHWVLAGLLVAWTAAAQDPGRAAERQVTMTLLYYYQCSAAFPDLESRYRKAYQAWRARNASEVAKVEPGMKAMLDDAAQRTRAADPKENASLRPRCESVLGATFMEEKSAPSRTPEEAWRRLLDALKAGDLERAVECYSSDARARYRRSLAALGPEGMKSFGSDFRSFALDSKPGTGDSATASVTTVQGRDFGVTFVRDALSGGWYIHMM